MSVMRGDLAGNATATAPNLQNDLLSCDASVRDSHDGSGFVEPLVVIESRQHYAKLGTVTVTSQQEKGVRKHALDAMSVAATATAAEDSNALK